jgi:hypothetical protein
LLSLFGHNAKHEGLEKWSKERAQLFPVPLNAFVSFFILQTLLYTL